MLYPAYLNAFLPTECGGMGSFMLAKVESGGSFTADLPGREARRSERVMLKVPLQLSARLPTGQRIRIEVMTLVVNAHGGLLDVGMEIEPGQKVMLNNRRSPELVTATVLRVENTELGRYFVAFEFEFPVHDFWPVDFPPDRSWPD
jgi:hypothetical protein